MARGGKHPLVPVGSSDAGMSLISALLGVAFAGGIAVVMSTQFSNMFKVQKKVENDAERVSLTNMLRSRVDCGKTLGATIPVNCSALGTYLTLKDKNGATVVNGSGQATKIGKWSIRATCDTTNDEIAIHVARTPAAVNVSASSSASFSKDPLTNQVLDWSHPKARLFEQGVGLCKPNFTPTATGFCPSPGVIRNATMCGSSTAGADHERMVGFDATTNQICCVQDAEYYEVTVNGGWLKDVDGNLFNVTCTNRADNLIKGTTDTGATRSVYSDACLSAVSRFCRAKSFRTGIVAENNATNGGSFGIYCLSKAYP